MKTIEIQLTSEQRMKLQQLLKDKELPWQVIKRLEVIRLLDKGCTTALIAQQLALRQELVRKYCSEFSKLGFDGLIHMEKPGKETLLTEAIFQALEQYIKSMGKKCSLRDLTSFLLKEYNITISEEWLSKRLAMRKQALREDPWR